MGDGTPARILWPIYVGHLGQYVFYIEYYIMQRTTETRRFLPGYAELLSVGIQTYNLVYFRTTSAEFLCMGGYGGGVLPLGHVSIPLSFVLKKKGNKKKER